MVAKIVELLLTKLGSASVETEAYLQPT